jgi:diaminopimelate decarboxylase
MAATEAQLQLAHVLPLGSRIDAQGHLEVGGCDTVELAKQFGTPAYVYAEDDLRARARAYVAALRGRHDNFDVLFASKAFPCTAAYRLFAAEGIACDVASGGELSLALRGGFDAARIYLHGNAKSLSELEEALDAGVGHIVLDSFDDIERLERVAGERGVRQAVLIRVTPGVAGRTHAAISTGQADSKFGFGLDDARVAIERTRGCEHLELQGLHMHIGSQLLSLDAYRPAVEAIATLGDFPVYNLGGGLGVAYTSEQHPPSIEEYVQVQVAAANELLGAGRKLLIEPGRSLVANACVTLYTVQTVKRNVSTWVGVDGGMSDNLRPMLYGSVYEALFADRADRAGQGERCHIAGKHCESGDVIVRGVPLDDPKPGDVLVTPATGAYGHAMANNYNGIPRPPVIFCKDGDARVVVRRETYDDLAARDGG